MRVSPVVKMTMIALPGDSCNTSTQVCETNGCRDTQLDCEIGEFCNVPTGECYEDDSLTVGPVL